MSNDVEPVLHERGKNGTWFAYNEQENKFNPTNRPYTHTADDYVGTRVVNKGGGRKPRHISHKRGRRNSKKSKHVRHTRRKQTRRHRHRR